MHPNSTVRLNVGTALYRHPMSEQNDSTPGPDGVQHTHTVRAFWSSLEARDWAGVEAALADDVVYEAPQTRERVRGRDAYVRFNQGFPGDWHVRVERVVADADGAATLVAGLLDGESMPATTFFTFAGGGADDGRIASITEFWPEPYPRPESRSHLSELY